MLLGRIFGDTHVEAHHTLICVPLNGIQVKTSLVIDSPSVSSRRGYSSYGIVDTKTIWFVFLLILPRWRVFFLGSPALHYAGADRLQMVGVRSLHVDCSWALVSSFSFHRKSSALFYLQQLVKYAITGTETHAARCLFNLFLNVNCNKMLEMWIKSICLNCVVLYCGSIATSRKDASRRKKNKEPREA